MAHDSGEKVQHYQEKGSDSNEDVQVSHGRQGGQVLKEKDESSHGETGKDDNQVDTQHHQQKDDTQETDKEKGQSSREEKEDEGKEAVEGKCPRMGQISGRKIAQYITQPGKRKRIRQ